jgi:hypothetical protein
LQATTSDFPRDRPDGPVIVVRGRVLGPGAYRPSSFADLEDTVEWWTALAVVGGLIVGAGLLVGTDQGDITAIVGVALFVVTAVLAGAERTELATALGVAGVVWTSAGISVSLGTDPSSLGSMIVFVAVGGAMVVVGALRAQSRSKPILNATG